MGILSTVSEKVERSKKPRIWPKLNRDNFDSDIIGIRVSDSVFD